MPAFVHFTGYAVHFTQHIDTLLIPSSIVQQASQVRGNDRMTQVVVTRLREFFNQTLYQFQT